MLKHAVCIKPWSTYIVQYVYCRKRAVTYQSQSALFLGRIPRWYILYPHQYKNPPLVSVMFVEELKHPPDFSLITGYVQHTLQN